MLASVGYRVRPSVYMTQPLKTNVLDHIARNLGFDLRETELAALSGYTPSAFSRAFHRQTGMTFVAYVNSLRINRGVPSADLVRSAHHRHLLRCRVQQQLLQLQQTLSLP